MRFRNGLAFFSRTNSRGHWNIASFHSPHSLTWQWILAFSLFRSDEARVWPLWWKMPGGPGLRWGFRIPFIGAVSWQTQRPMWYRDLYARLRDDRDMAENRMWPGSAYVPPGPVVVVTDQNLSVH